VSGFISLETQIHIDDVHILVFIRGGAEEGGARLQTSDVWIDCSEAMDTNSEQVHRLADTTYRVRTERATS